MCAFRTLAGGLLVPLSYRTGRTDRHVRRTPGGRSLVFESAPPYAVSDARLAVTSRKRSIRNYSIYLGEFEEREWRAAMEEVFHTD